MVIEQKTNYIELIPEKDYHLSNKDKSEMYEGYICLGKYDSPENYIEVTNEEYDEWKRLQEQAEAKRLQEEENASLTNLE